MRSSFYLVSLLFISALSIVGSHGKIRWPYSTPALARPVDIVNLKLSVVNLKLSVSTYALMQLLACTDLYIDLAPTYLLMNRPIHASQLWDRCWNKIGLAVSYNLSVISSAYLLHSSVDWAHLFCLQMHRYQNYVVSNCNCLFWAYDIALGCQRCARLQEHWLIE